MSASKLIVNILDNFFTRNSNSLNKEYRLIHKNRQLFRILLVNPVALFIVPTLDLFFPQNTIEKRDGHYP